jgi:hypothetical protein
VAGVSESGVTLGQGEIRGVLSSADELARSAGVGLRERLPGWAQVVEGLRTPQCPRTYLPVLAVLLTARALRPQSELDVLDIQQQTSRRGFSAASIGKVMIPFSVEQGIDLRSKSSQIMNNQPFTFKARITPRMSSPLKAAHYEAFYSATCSVNALEPSAALSVLALLFDLCRVTAPTVVDVVHVTGGKPALTQVVQATAQFASRHSDNGRVGQAFVAAVLDVLYGANRVVLGNTADPDSSVPGDVQVADDQEVWLWAEVKQKSVTTGDVEQFIGKVRKVGGGRILYCALGNERYPHNIDRIRIARIEENASIEVSVVISPADLLGEMLRVAPGTFDSVASGLATAMVTRLHEAGCQPATLDAYRDLL